MAEFDPKLCHGSRAAGARSQLSAFRLSRCCALVSASRARLRVTDAKTPFGPDTTGINAASPAALICTLAMIQKVSPAAWRHIHLNGRYTFRDSGQVIDLDAIVAGLNLP